MICQYGLACCYDIHIAGMNMIMTATPLTKSRSRLNGASLFGLKGKHLPPPKNRLKLKTVEEPLRVRLRAQNRRLPAQTG